ncbi:MAG: tetratricopeptide repeat protein [Deltaproteobacteria bacterium]|jgi:hypothetical protein|nr:tetratricopeptide repeat protein [Deltaproteobacteria bacterium]MBW2533864.1 tetratricopeptide repeat protein [Deltaproteobacteria bacterium]
MVACLKRVGLVPLLATTLAVSSVEAAPGADTKARAAELFEQGRQQMADEQFEGACASFQQSFDLVQGVGIQYNLAQCMEALGKLATARRHFREVAAVAERAGQHDRAKVARERAAALEPKVSSLTVRVHSPVPGQTVRCGDLNFGQAKWDRPVELDPGRYDCESSAPGHEPWTGQADIEGEAERAALTVPALALTGGAGSPPNGGGEQGATETGDVASDGEGVSPQLVAGIVVGGLGLVGLGVGAGFGAMAKSKHDDSEAYCDPTGCDPAGLELIDDAQVAGNVSTGLFIGGAALLAGGIVLIVTAPSGSETDPGDDVALRLSVTPSSAGAAATWRF